MQRIRLYTAALTALLLAARPASSQIFTISGDMFNPVQGSVKMQVLDAATDAPVEFASVYLTAKNDTLITNFTLTDTTGRAELTKVNRGTYNLTVELLGYKKYVKEHYFNFTWDSEVKELGVIRLEEDHEILDAAHVSAIGNPVEIRQDTIIFNPASFMLGQNDMLEDLLKRMPGMEVSKEGTVKYNGETIQKITVGGKTFFFDDPSMALKNLPAKVVDKVKVIDKVSDAEKFSGVATDREKVMDLEFKKEFQEGWFGNARAGAGTTLAGDRKDEMVDDRGLIYNGNVMVTGYSDKDQLVLIGSAYNAPISGDGLVVVFRTDDEDDISPVAGGIQTYRQIGANYNTTRIKGMESTAMASYNHSFDDSRNRSSRTTWGTGGSDIFSRSESKNFTSSDKAKVSLELKNTDRNKVLFTFEPNFQFTFGKIERYNDNDASMAREGMRLNSSSSSSYQESKQFVQHSSFTLGIRNLGDKRRNLTLTGNYALTNFDADSREFSRTLVRSSSDEQIKDLFYVTGNHNYRGTARLTYVEPIAKDWVLSLSVSGNGNIRDNGKRAFDRTSGAPGYNASVIDRNDYTRQNDYYSTQMKNTYVSIVQSAQFQYSKGQTSVQIGAQTLETLNETYSKSLGRETRTGVGEWLFDWSPYLNLRWSKKQNRFTLLYNGSTVRVSNSNLLPVLDISVPTRLRAGNIYLQNGYRHTMSANASFNNPQSQRNGNISFSGNLLLRPLVTASWFDSDGIQYSVPVNSVKPSFTGFVYGSLGIPLTSDKRLSINANFSLTETRAVSYQNTHRLESMDIATFDYGKFMEWFWGNERGDNFYSGKSGFSESLTNSLAFSPSLSLRYRGDRITAWVHGSTTLNTYHYSLDNSADTRTWRNSVGTSFDWSTPHEWEISTNANYYFYNGFPEGYNEPYTAWDFSVTKNIKAWAISFNVNDILNSARNFRHITTANYVEDSMQNMLGRHFFISLKWNFGKLNAAKNASATNAALRMTF
ncbi:MAG: TonB-dependent receptor [Bacteroidales bacterium]|nr:TonB-dependent receptor [Bacteroidales bacterium]